MHFIDSNAMSKEMKKAAIWMAASKGKMQKPKGLLKRIAAPTSLCDCDCCARQLELRLFDEKLDERLPIGVVSQADALAKGGGGQFVLSRVQQ
jgi:hypothetical protein